MLCGARKTGMKTLYRLVLKSASVCTLLLGLLVAPLSAAAGEGFVFRSIDGGEIDTGDWRGKPLLVVNTASRCGFTRQYDDMQLLFDKYRASGFGLIAVPSDDFNQELGSDAEIKAFCEVNFGLDMPMTTSLSVKGAEAHPFYRAVAQQTGFVPRWNFNKVLIGADGEVVGTWGSSTKPLSGQITRAIEAELAKAE